MNSKNKKLLSKINSEKRHASITKIKRKRRRELAFIILIFLIFIFTKNGNSIGERRWTSSNGVRVRVFFK